MTSPPAKSYYEIALTNRQVLAVFVVLLLAVLAAFVGGVWVGRRGPLATVQTAGGTGGEAAQIVEGEEPLERFDFFSRDDAGQEGEGVEPEQAVVAEVDAGEPQVGAPPSDPVETVPPVDAGDPSPDEPDESADEGPEERQVAEAPEPEPTAPEPEPADPEPEPAAPQAAPAATAGSLVVQVFSSSNQVQAQGVVDQLRSGGYPALLSPVEVSGRTMYRVRIGPYADRTAAERIAEEVRRDFRLETWITQ